MIRFSVSRLVALAAALAAGVAPLQALTYHISYLEDEGKRAQITAVMNEAVAVYNATTNFNVDINVVYHSGIPTAQANYNGELGFGGSISVQVALHEIAHYLGSGTTWEWENQFGGDDVWDGPAVRRFIKLFDGPGAELRRSGVHYYPYGFNYGNEDSPLNRKRLPILVQAMRMDMGFQDGDGDGMSDEWERYKAGHTGMTAAGDADGDGISNYDEWWTLGEPLQPVPIKSGRVYQLRNRLSQKLLEAADATAGANVRQNPNNGSDLQKWVATYVSGGFWKFTNLASGKAFEVINYSWDAGANVIAWNDTGGTNQQWRLVPDGAGYFRLFNRNSMNMAVDVTGGLANTSDGLNIAQYPEYIGGINQDWAFDDVTPGAQTGGLAAEYKLDGNARDTGGRGLDGTPAGGISYGAGRIDVQAATFNGTNGTIRIPSPTDRNFTLTCWVKTGATAANGQWYNGMGLIDGEVGGAAADFGLAMVGNKAAFGVGNPDKTILSATAINDNVWHHLAATLDTATGAMKLYVDGLLSASDTGPAGARFAPSALSLGSIAGVTGFFNGSLDEVRIHDEILDPARIYRLARIESTRLARYPFDGGVRDASPFGNHGDASGVTFTAGKVGTHAAQFDGSGSFVRIPAAVAGDFTVAYWVKTTATGGTGQWYAGRAMVDAEVPGVVADWGIALVGNKVGLGMGNPDRTIVSSTVVNDGAWHHVVATRKNSNGQFRLYVDGVLQGTDIGGTTPRTAGGRLRVGSSLYGGQFFAGAIDDLQLFNYPLAAQEVAALAGVVPAGFTSVDVGDPVSDGYAARTTGGDTISVVGSGTDIAGTADQFHFLNTPVTDDREAIARIETAALHSGGTFQLFTKTGVMFRASLAPDAAFGAVVHEFGRGLRLLVRGSTGATVAQAGPLADAPAPPVWVRLVRRDNSLTAFSATTTGPPAAGDWVQFASAEVELGATPLGGLAVTSRNPAIVVNSRFSGFSLDALPAGDPGEVWRLLHFGTAANAGDAADAADPDGDGITNRFERAYGTDPKAPTPPDAAAVLARAGDAVTFTYPRSLAATDLVYEVQWSSDLRNWSATGVTETVVTTTAQQEIREARVPLSQFDGQAGFLRLSVR